MIESYHMDRWLAVTLFALVCVLLVYQRFSGPPELPVRIIAGSGEETEPFYGFGEKLKRGSSVITHDNMLKLSIGKEAEELHESDTVLWLAQNTQVTLERLYENEIVIKLVKGRVVVSTQTEFPLVIETNLTKHMIHKAVASFVNYDFLETVHVIPLAGYVQTIIGGQTMATPVPISIHETEPVGYSALEVNLNAGDSASFYEWTGVLTKESTSE